MPATKISTEQAPCPCHNCPQATPPTQWFDIRYCFPDGGKNMWEREAYWTSVNRPDGVRWDCPSCWKMDSYIDEQQFLARKHIGDLTIKKLKQAAKNGRHKGAWTLCFNYSPSWYENDYEAQEAIRLAVNRLLRYYKEDLEEFRAVGEFTKAGRSHVHIFYRLASGGKFTDKNLKRAYPHWDAKKKVGDGVQGGQHVPVIDVANYTGYIEKDLDVSWMHIDINQHAQEVHVPFISEEASQSSSETHPSSSPPPSP